MSSANRIERNLLSFSTLSALLFALMGIGLGLWMGSLVIIFDGAYSFVSLALSLVSLTAAWYLRTPRAQQQPRQRRQVQAGVVAFKGFAITLMCTVSLVSAIQAILNGGREINTGLALVFGVVNVLGCLATYWVLVHYRQRARSSLIIAESKQWLMDTVISAAVMLGFIIASVMTYLGWHDYAVYADPVMVVVASVYFVLVPLKMMRDAIRRLRIHYVLQRRDQQGSGGLPHADTNRTDHSSLSRERC
ncbi:cation transporter [Pseudidiomarina sediminum]|uniref:Cation transporter n=1 Tax=Pseudidiomarina sediminum TaxID=431675 RepID=A0A432YZE5_9GAMM|nr:cation transporter [Pseudidiomarina sediminum]RUO68996.1 cation transporter [Pseudidiomarina sediminum]